MPEQQCGGCRFWYQYLDHKPNVGQCTAIRQQDRLRLDSNDDPVAWIEVGEQYCDGELWTCRLFSCPLFEPGSYEVPNG
jgi:hypothetical protein